MKLQDVGNITQTRGIHPGRHSKTDSIETLEAERDGSGCFAAAA